MKALNWALEWGLKDEYIFVNRQVGERNLDWDP